MGIYSSETFWAESVAAFLAPALAEGGGVLAVVTAAHRPALDEALLQAGIDVAQVRAGGRYVVSDADEVLSGLLVGGEIDPGRFRATADLVLARARRHGAAFRVYGEMAPLLWTRGDIPNALHLERLWNDVLTEHGFPLLCLYRAEGFDGPDHTEAFLELCERHTEIGPVERYLPLLAADPRRRARALLEKQSRTSNTDRERRRVEGDELRTQVTLVTDRMRARQRSFDRVVTDRDLVGQATGILMVRWRVDADTAGRMLVDAASRSRRPLPEVARSVVDRQVGSGRPRHPAVDATEPNPAG